MRPRTAFLGTPEFAVPSLDALSRLAEAGEIEIAAVVTQPDRPGHRGRLAVPAVKRRALELGLPVFQPERLSGAAPGELAKILALRPELLVWAAYGGRVPRWLLEAADGRAVNVHASLLPRWRGAAPVAHAILAGDAMTGVTLMEGTAELDAGPILAQESTPIQPEETEGELRARLALLGAALLERELPRYVRGELVGRPQEAHMASSAPKLEPAAGALDFRKPAEDLARSVRAYTPEPGAFTALGGQRVGVLRALAVEGGAGALPGTVELRGGEPHVSTAEGWLRLDEVHPAGKRAMSGADWARGRRDLDGARLG